MPLVNKGSYTFLLLFGCPLFLFLHLFALPRTSSTILNRRWEWHPYFTPGLRRKPLNFLLLTIILFILSILLLHMNFAMLAHIPATLNLWKQFSFSCTFSYFLCWERVHCGIYKNSYNISNVSYLNSLCLPFSFMPPFPEVSTGIIFAFTCMYTCTLFTLFPTTSPLPLVPNFLPPQ
jgi:hypothetical protein